MKAKLTGLIIGAAAGFVMSWARVSDPAVIRDMLLVRDAHVFLVMGSAVAVASVGVRMLRAFTLQAFVTGGPKDWSVERPRARHVSGAALFAVAWSVAGTCPGPVAAMVGEGSIGGLAVVAGLMAGIARQRAWAQRQAAGAPVALPAHAVV